MTALAMILIICNYLTILDLLNSGLLILYLTAILNHIFLSEKYREKEAWQKTSEY